MSQIFNFKLKSIILTVGASHSGKSHFSKKNVIPALKSINNDFNVQYLSSDEIRREILDDALLDRNDKKMMFASQQAFEFLFKKLELLVQFPINSDFIIVDTTGLDDNFRKEVKKLAAENSYNFYLLIFDYKERDDFYSNVPIDSEYNVKRVVSIHIKKLKENKKFLSKKVYPNQYEIKNKDFNSIEICVDENDLSMYSKSKLPNNVETVIISDIHGSYDEFIELLKINGFSVDEEFNILNVLNKQLIINGDYIDKGEKIVQVVNLLHKNLDKPFIKIVKGNHENFVYKALMGKLEKDVKEASQDMFSSVSLYSQESQENKVKLLEVIESSFEFYRNDSFIVTHAPCRNKFLGKFDNISLKNQRTNMYPKFDEKLTKEQNEKIVEDHFKFILDDAKSNQPYHVFGHVAVYRNIQIKNKIFADTGCVYGGQLSSVTITTDGKVIFKHVNPSVQRENVTLTLFKEKNVSLSNFADDVVRQSKMVLKNRINFISGTISPVAKNVIDYKLESIETGIEYYLSKGVNQIILQPKFMGSRLNVYLFEDPSKSYGVTRNGYILKQTDLISEYDRLWKLCKHKLDFDDEPEMFILDCEFLPWSALGKGLIDKQFTSYGKAILAELDALNKYDFNKSIDAVKNEFDSTTFEKDRCNLSNKDLSEKFGNHKKGTYESYLNFKNSLKLDFDLEGTNIDNFNKQVVLYGSDGDLIIKPFMLLKTVYKSGEENINFDNTVFKNINVDSDYLMLDFGNLTAEERNTNKQFGSVSEMIEYTVKYYNNLVEDQKHEGVVIKPFLNDLGGKYAPMLKCRNSEYLRIIYGYNYLNDVKFKRLFDSKKVDRKISTSIKEFKLGYSLLNCKYSELTPENEEQLLLVCKLIGEIENEKTLDPRL